MTRTDSTVRVTVGSDEGGWFTVDGVSDYAISIDVRTPADAFAFTFQTSKELYQACQPDNEVRVFIDDRRIFTGLIDDRGRSVSKAEGSKITIRGRDFLGRLVDESAPLVRYTGLGILDLAKRIIDGSPITTVVGDNVKNRRIRGGKVPNAGTEPPIFNTQKAPKKVEPGETSWQVLAHLMEESGYLCFTSADGRTLIVAKPNHNQPPAHTLLYAPAGARRAMLNNIVAIDDVTSLGEMYSLIVALVQPFQTTSNEVSANYAPARRGESRDNPASADGVGGNFRVRKRLVIQDDAASSPRDRADRELKERLGEINKKTITVEGHKEVTAVGQAVYYTNDLVVRYEDDEVGIAGDYYVAGVVLTGSRNEGQRTTLGLVPRGTDLRLSGA